MLICATRAAGAPAPSAPSAAATPAAAAPSPAPGFYPDGETLFAPVLALASPGPNRAARALAALDRQLAFQRRISFHPEFGEALQKVIDAMPPRQSTLIRAAALYARADIPWTVLPDGIRRISVAGRPDDTHYLYTLTQKYAGPEEPARMAGMFALQPSLDWPGAGASSVIGELSGELLLDTYGGGAIVDSGAAILREVRGDLRPPWDTAPGQFNHHDQAALARLRRDMPTVAARLDHYFEFHNVLDEFDGGARGPIVLFNLDAEVRPAALEPFPHLYDFYRKVAPTLVAESAITDARGNYWMRTQFDRGHIHISFMDQDGLLTPFDAAGRPAGAGIAIDRVLSGSYRTRASVSVRRLRMRFGLDHIGVASTFHRTPDAVVVESKMDQVPELVAPPVIHKIADLIAGEFLRVMAQGHGGLTVMVSSRRRSDGMFRLAAGLTGEFTYSPTLEFLARIGDAVADQHNAEVRADERKLGEELFDAFATDYNNARPKILALDVNPDSHP
jgi:hypothetical protein